MDIRRMSLHDIYLDIVTMQAIILELFSKEDKKGKPRLGVFSLKKTRGTSGFSGVLSYLKMALFSLKWHPSRPEGGEHYKLALNIVKYYDAAFYEPELHAILFNRADPKCQHYYVPVAIEEAAHSVLSISDGNITNDAVDVASYKGHSGCFGNALSRALRSAGLETIVMDINEFFPPLAQAYMIGILDGEPAFFEQAAESITYFQPEKTSAERAEAMQSHMLHLPQVAGYMLAKQYKYDIEALLREHPSLPHLSGPEIWESYCLPILVNGRL